MFIFFCMLKYIIKVLSKNDNYTHTLFYANFALNSL